MTVKEVRERWQEALNNFTFYSATGTHNNPEERQAAKEYKRWNEERLKIDEEYRNRYYGLDD